MIELISQQTLHELRLRTHEPCPRLKPWVQCFWSMDGTGERLSRREKFYPDGGSSIIIRLCCPEPRIHLVVNRRTYQQAIDNRCPGLGVRFTPGGLYALFGLSLEPFDEQVLRLELGRDITPGWYAGLRRLVETMPGACRAQRVAKVRTWLVAQLQLSELADHRTGGLVKAVQESSATLRELTRQIGMTQRTLERRLKRETGFSPLELVGYARIRRARELLCVNRLSLVDVAIQSGFYDQAHFSHAFKRLTLETPAHYRQRKLSQIYNT